MRQHLLMLLLICTFLLLGCIYDDNSKAMKRFVAEMRDEPYELNLGKGLEPCPTLPCRMFACGFTASPWNEEMDRPYGKYPSLVGGACADALCDMETLENLYKKIIPNKLTGYALKPNIFSVGVGPGYWEFEYANTFANSSMRSITIFLSSRAKHYPLADPRLATCYLDKGVLPIYVFYAEDDKADFESMRKSMIRSAELMEKAFARTYEKDGERDVVGPVGPVIFVTDPHLDLTNISMVEKVANLINEVETTCPHCMVAVGMEFNNSKENYELVGNYTFWYKLFYSPHTNGIYRRESVIGGNEPILLAVGLDSRKFDDCNVKKMYWELMNFTSYALQIAYDVVGGTEKGEILTIVPYVYFGKGKGCSVTKEDVSEGLALLFTTAPSFPYYGILSINIYQPISEYFDPLNTINNPNSQFPLPTNPKTAKENEIKKLEPMHNAFFGFARAYYTGAGKYEQALPPVPLVFSYGCNRTCGMAANFNILRYENFSSGRIDIFEEFKKYQPSEPVYSCLFNYIDKLPEEYSLRKGSAAVCLAYYPMLDDIANRFGIAPDLLRAVVQVESGFNEQQVIYQPMSASCNPKKLMLNELFPGQFPNEEEYYVDDRFIDDPVTPCRPKSSFVSDGDKKHMKEKCKPCEFGLTAREYLPSSTYTKYHQNIPEAVKYCDFDGNGYNPFDPAENLCAYAYDFNKALWGRGGAWDEVRGLASSFDIVDKNNSEYFNYVEWLALFRALDKAHRWQGKEGQHKPCNLNNNECGFTDWVNAFAKSGKDDFFNFVKEDIHNNEKSFAYDILTTFLTTRKRCVYPPAFSDEYIDVDMIYIPYKEYISPD